MRARVDESVKNASLLILYLSLSARSERRIYTHYTLTEGLPRFTFFFTLFDFYFKLQKERAPLRILNYYADYLKVDLVLLL